MNKAQNMSPVVLEEKKISIIGAISQVTYHTVETLKESNSFFLNLATSGEGDSNPSSL